MPRKPRTPRGAKGRMASPAQMARLSDVLQRPFPAPIQFETYRHMLRRHRNPDSNALTEWDAWEHLESRDTETSALVQHGSQALHAARLARVPPPGEGKV